MLQEHEAKMRAQGLDPNLAQPGMVVSILETQI
jgi:hypothetical protein